MKTISTFAFVLLLAVDAKAAPQDQAAAPRRAEAGRSTFQPESAETTRIRNALVSRRFDPNLAARVARKQPDLAQMILGEKPIVDTDAKAHTEKFGSKYYPRLAPPSKPMLLYRGLTVAPSRYVPGLGSTLWASRKYYTAKSYASGGGSALEENPTGHLRTVLEFQVPSEVFVPAVYDPHGPRNDGTLPRGVIADESLFLRRIGVFRVVGEREASKVKWFRAADVMRDDGRLDIPDDAIPPASR